MFKWEQRFGDLCYFPAQDWKLMTLNEGGMNLYIIQQNGIMYFCQQKFEDTKGVIRTRESKKR